MSGVVHSSVQGFMDLTLFRGAENWNPWNPGYWISYLLLDKLDKTNMLGNCPNVRQCFAKLSNGCPALFADYSASDLEDDKDWADLGGL